MFTTTVLAAGGLNTSALAYGVEQVLRLGEDSQRLTRTLRAHAMIPALLAVLMLGMVARTAPRACGAARPTWTSGAGVRPFGAADGAAVIRSFIVGPPCIALVFAGGAVAELTDADDLGMAIGAIGLLAALPCTFRILLFNRRRRWSAPAHQPRAARVAT